MSDYGVKASGFVRKRLPEQLNEIREQLKSGLGQNIEFTPDTVLGVISHIIAERHATLWELVEAVYATMYPMSATGVNLDKAVSFIGVSRLQEQPSSCALVWYGKSGTVIPRYSEVRNKSTQVSYFAEDEVTISADNVYHAIIGLASSEIKMSDTLSLTINGVAYRYQTDRASAKYALEKLFAKLADVNFINAELNNLSISITASGITGFSLSVNDKLTISTLGTMGRVKTDLAGTDYANVGDITEIIDLVDGLQTVNNLTQGTAGRKQESDTELYQRYHLGVWHTGAGTAEAIRANLLKVEGVVSAAVYENRNNSVDQHNLPPHSLYCVVKGGLDSDIAQTILTYAPAGITLHGDKTVNAEDSQGIAHQIKFGRPRKVYIWVNVIVNTFVDQSEFAQVGYSTKIIESILAYGKGLKVGEDVIIQRLVGKCVEIKGVGKVQITMGKTTALDSLPPVYAENNITIAPDEEAVFNRAIIQVT